jgi:hypothetical protein
LNNYNFQYFRKKTLNIWTNLIFQPTWRVCRVIEEICRVPDLSIKQASIFGLAQKHENFDHKRKKRNKFLGDEIYFLKKDCKICDYAPKGWLSGKQNVKLTEFILVLKTQYFVSSPMVQLDDAGSRSYYYLGLSRNVAKSKVNLPIETAMEIISLGLQVRLPP